MRLVRNEAPWKPVFGLRYFVTQNLMHFTHGFHSGILRPKGPLNVRLRAPSTKPLRDPDVYRALYLRECNFISSGF